MPRLLYAFMLCNLVIGTGAFIIGGILVPISESLQVGVATAGQAMTAYALSTAVLAPLALVLTGTWPRKRALCAGLAVFGFGNALCALAPDFATLLAGRVLMGVGAMFTPIAAGIAVALVEPARSGRALSLTLLYFIAIFTVFAYIGPVLQALQPMSPERLSLTLAIFGLSGVVGTLVGGWANDHFGARRSLTVQLAVLGATMVLLPLARGHALLIVATFVVWGIAGFGMMAPQQSRLAMLAPAQAPILLSLNTSMLYFGTALGAAVGGAASAHVAFSHLSWVGVPFAIAGLATLRVGAAQPGLAEAGRSGSA